MDLFLLAGIIIGTIAVLVGMLSKGASISVLLSPEAGLIIFVGLIAATLNSYPIQEIKRIPKMLKVLFTNKEYNYAETIRQLVELANKARKDGLLALEDPVQKLEDPFMKKGLEMVVDGVDPDEVREIMENEIDGIEERHRVGAGIFKTAGSTAPTLGVLGAVIGLIGALGNLQNVGKLGEMISSAFVATMFGIFFGYVILTPIGSRLTVKSDQEVQSLNLVLEGVLAIQAGQAPRSIEQKLNSLIAPSLRSQDQDQDKEERGK
ncbi:MAG: flagellar motor stator protein MotA [Liquorilactobacillus ghanensis]|uniref:flagellar motor stator protein MotA n=1 Tax=Liquorilactobacillus ghanensis TaxID=399370 RepID=UPI0039E87136